jgi:hypothetical protein
MTTSTTHAAQGRLFSNVKAYVGQTRSRALVAQLEAAGVGECVTRGQLPPRRGSWFYDNGAFEDFQAGRAFDYAQWSRDMRAIRLWVAGGVGRGMLTGSRMTAPDFQVVPDLVAQGNASLTFSLCHLTEAKQAGVPCYLAVQDGMTEAAVRSVLAHGFDGLFVGGTLAWKLETAAQWVALGRQLGLPVHIGRVGTLDRVAWAQALGATSIDSSFPLWNRDRLDAFVAAVA